MPHESPVVTPKNHNSAPNATKELTMLYSHLVQFMPPSLYEEDRRILKPEQEGSGENPGDFTIPHPNANAPDSLSLVSPLTVVEKIPQEGLEGKVIKEKEKK